MQKIIAIDIEIQERLTLLNKALFSIDTLSRGRTGNENWKCISSTPTVTFTKSIFKIFTPNLAMT